MVLSWNGRWFNLTFWPKNIYKFCVYSHLSSLLSQILCDAKSLLQLGGNKVLRALSLLLDTHLLLLLDVNLLLLCDVKPVSNSLSCICGYENIQDQERLRRVVMD